jgi:hypothetical protein
MNQKNHRIPMASRATHRRILDARWDGKSVFSIPEAGEITGLSRASIYAAARSGELPTVWIGGRRVVPRHSLEALLVPD